MSSLFEGVLAPVLTPYNSNLEPDRLKLLDHCKWLLRYGAGLAVFGTNSEGNSLSVEEKCDLIDYLCSSGIQSDRMMPGTGSCSLTDTVTLTRAAVDNGCGGVLMLPPFYYKDVTDDGLFASFAEIIDRVGSQELRIYLYHIPPVAQVGISVSLVERLKRRFGRIIAGIKDSSGDWANTKALHEADLDEFSVFVGSERFLLQNMRSRGAGCISATANISPSVIGRLYERWDTPDADNIQKSLNSVRDTLKQYPVIAALKAVKAIHLRDPEWAIVRPPLESLPQSQWAPLTAQLEKSGYTYPE